MCAMYCTWIGSLMSHSFSNAARISGVLRPSPRIASEPAAFVSRKTSVATSHNVSSAPGILFRK